MFASSSSMMTRLVCAFTMAVWFAGCGNGPAPAETDETSAGAKAGDVEIGAGRTGVEPGTAASAAAPVPGAQLRGAELDAALERLTQALRKYSFERRRVPKSIGEVVAAGYVKEMPPAPPGKTFAINPTTMQVMLVNE